MALNELNKTAALSWRNLDVGDLAKALEERAKFVLGNVARESTNKDSGVVGVGELVHRLRLSGERRHWVWLHSWVSTTHHWVHSHWWRSSLVLVLWSRGADAHWAVATVDALHLGKSALLVALVGEANEAVSAR